jgi:hypothetical protein
MRCASAPSMRRQAEAGMKAEPVEVGREARLQAGDTKVRHQRQPEPAANRRPVHGGHHRLAAREQAERLVVQRVDGARAARRGHRCLALRKVGAGTEGRALRRQHDGAALRIGFEPLERVGQRGNQRDIEVVMRRAAQFDHGDVAVVFDADRVGGRDDRCGHGWDAGASKD